MKTGKMVQEGILTAIVGSYPKPKSISKKTGRQILDELGATFDADAKRVGAKKFAAKLDAAARDAVKDQNDAGVDLVTDGEERRNHYVLHVLKGMEGIDFEKRTRVVYRGGIYE